MARMNLDVNGKVETIDADPDMPLLYALRNELALNNPHLKIAAAEGYRPVLRLQPRDSGALTTNRGLITVTVGKLAQGRGTTNVVRRFGQMLVTDHTASLLHARNLASQLGVTLPARPGAAVERDSGVAPDTSILPRTMLPFSDVTFTAPPFPPASAPAAVSASPPRATPR